MTHQSPIFPMIRTGGVDGLLVTFGDKLSEPANRAALSFRVAVEEAGWDAVEETSSTLVSCFIRFDPLRLPHDVVKAKVETLAKSRNWFDAALPTGRRFWRIPTVYGTELAPQLAQAAATAGMSEAEAATSLSDARVRVQALGFAPGQPYLGELPESLGHSPSKPTDRPRPPRCAGRGDPTVCAIWRFCANRLAARRPDRNQPVPTPSRRANPFAAR